MAETAANTARNALSALDDEDLDLVVRFLLADGSIKDLAAACGVSYPTMRSRLDSLLDRVRSRVSGKRPDALEDYLADLIARGGIAPAHARRLRDLYRNAKNGNHPPGSGG